MNKYAKPIPKGLTSLDVYDVLIMFDVCDPAIQHAVKKLLACGQRGHKNAFQDLREARESIDRALECLPIYYGEQNGN